MGFFRSAHSQRTAAAARELCDASDVLALSRDDIATTATRHGLDVISADLLSHLFSEAIERDVRRLVGLFQASGWTTMPPARLVADWAIGLGPPAPKIVQMSAASAAPVRLAQAYLKAGRIDVPQRDQLVDVARAYGAPPESALAWIEAAVSAEIDTYVARARLSDSWWKRWVGSQSN